MQNKELHKVLLKGASVHLEASRRFKDEVDPYYIDYRLFNLQMATEMLFKSMLSATYVFFKMLISLKFPDDSEDEVINKLKSVIVAIPLFDDLDKEVFLGLINYTRDPSGLRHSVHKIFPVNFIEQTAQLYIQNKSIFPKILSELTSLAKLKKDYTNECENVNSFLLSLMNYLSQGVTIALTKNYSTLKEFLNLDQKFVVPSISEIYGYLNFYFPISHLFIDLNLSVNKMAPHVEKLVNTLDSFGNEYFQYLAQIDENSEDLIIGRGLLQLLTNVMMKFPLIVYLSRIRTQAEYHDKNGDEIDIEAQRDIEYIQKESENLFTLIIEVYDIESKSQ